MKVGACKNENVVDLMYQVALHSYTIAEASILGSIYLKLQIEAY